MTVPAGDRDALKAWLHERLTQDRARAQWQGLLSAGWSQLRATELSTLFPPDAVQGYIDAHLDPDVIAAILRPLSGAGLLYLTHELRAEDKPLDHFVPAEARAAIERIATRPNMVNQAWIEAFFREKAVEDVVSDTLYRALRDFSTIIPRLVTKVLPTTRFKAIGLAGNLTERLAGQIEKLIEPEIRNFIGSGSQRALERAAAFTIEHIDDPTSIAMRKNAVDMVLSKSPSFHLQQVDDDVLAEVTTIDELVARRLVATDEVRQGLVRWVGNAVDKYGSKTLGEVLDELGYDRTPPFDRLAELTWPTWCAFMQAPPVMAFVDGVVDEMVDVWTNGA